MVRSDSADEERMMDEKIEVDDDDEYDDAASMETGGGGASAAAPGRRWSTTTAARGTPSSGFREGSGGGASSVSPTSGSGNAPPTETDRRMRRQIANCNERRRMQSINAGFQSLRALLPRKEGEKLSKAAILQQTAELIQQLRAERVRLVERGAINEEELELCASPQPNSVWKKPRLDRDSDGSFDSPSSSTTSASSSGGGGNLSLDPALIEQLRLALDRERSLRVLYEHRLAQLSSSGASATSSAPLSPVQHAAGVAAAAAAHHSGCAVPLLAADASVIRPTPTQPLRVDVSLANIVSLSAAGTPAAMTAPRSPPPAAGLSPSLAHLGGLALAPPPPAPPLQPQPLAPPRALHAILEAIRHLEGGTFAAASASPPPPPTSHANLLVR